VLFPNFASAHLERKNLFGMNLPSLDNYYGYTCAWRDVNEGNEIIDFIFSGDCSQEKRRQRFITFLGMMRARRTRPLIFKNVRAYAYLEKLYQVFPHIHFLRIKRNPEQLVQSVLKAYRELGTFHPVPDALSHMPLKDPIEFAARQISTIEQTLDEKRTLINGSNWTEWRYDDFCSRPHAMIKTLVERTLEMDTTVLRWANLPDLHASKRMKVSKQDAQRIRELLQQIDKRSLHDFTTETTE
jgi:hypothetical protein